MARRSPRATAVSPVLRAATGIAVVLSMSGAGPAATAATAATAAGSAGSRLPRFSHVVIVVEENRDYAQSDSAAMPYLHSLMARYGSALQYHANTHPSIGNYFVLTAGQVITNDNGHSATLTDDNIVRHLLAAGKTWKSYAEDLPAVGYTGQGRGAYTRRHNPLSYFSDVVNDPAQRRRLVPFTQFATDLAGDSLPSYSFVVPNLCHDAHDCSLTVADNWLRTNIGPLLASRRFQASGLLVIVFDESASDNAHGGGRIAWTAISPWSKRGYTSSTLYQHENTLRLMAEGLGLTSFPGQAADAANMAEFFAP